MLPRSSAPGALGASKGQIGGGLPPGAGPPTGFKLLSCVDGWLAAAEAKAEGGKAKRSPPKLAVLGTGGPATAGNDGGRSMTNMLGGRS